MSHRSRSDAPAGGIAPSPAAELVNKMLVWPYVRPGDNGNHENRYRRPPQDAAQRRTEQRVVEPRVMRTSHHDQVRIAASSDLEYRAVGEAGTVGAPPAVVNAVLDALAPFGIEHLDTPLRPDRIWNAIATARRRQGSTP